MVAKCSEGGGEAVQLAVLRALLTIATADHFLVHGDCLMQVRTQSSTISPVSFIGPPLSVVKILHGFIVGLDQLKLRTTAHECLGTFKIYQSDS